MPESTNPQTKERIIRTFEDDLTAMMEERGEILSEALGEAA